MTDQEIRLTIAEFMGWQWWKYTKLDSYIFAHPDRTKESLDDDQMQWEQCSRPTRMALYYGVGCPHYLDDLNAMYDAEEKLDCKQMDAYVTALLRKSTQKDMPHIRSNLNMYIVVHASPSQRANAFVEAIGKLPDETQTDTTKDK